MVYGAVNKSWLLQKVFTELMLCKLFSISTQTLICWILLKQHKHSGELFEGKFKVIRFSKMCYDKKC